MKKLKITAFLLAVLMIIGGLVSCGDKKPADNTGNTQDSTVAGATDPAENNGEPTTEARILPDIPEREDFGGHVFTVLSHREESDDWFAPVPREILAEVQDAEEPINDAVYRRNVILKDRYNIDFKIVDNTDEAGILKKVVGAGDDIYDAVIIFNNKVPVVVKNNNLINVADLKYIDLNKPWWDPAVNSLSIDHKNYLMAGDLLILDNEATNALLFNKKLFTETGIDLPYNMVADGKWTMDKFNEYIRGASKDVNGDGKMTPNEDKWGFVCYRDTLHALLVSGGGSLAVKDENDLPVMSFTTQRNLAVFDKITEIMYNKEDVLNIQVDISDGGANSSNWLTAYHRAFEEDRALFIWVRMRVVEKFRGMESEFGILPLPKFDETQDKYYSAVNAWTGVLLGVPKTVQNTERTSIILEAMAAESRYTLQPAYYDVVLQRKFARDDESSEMLDIIFGSNPLGERSYDIGAAYYFGNAFEGFIHLCNKNDKNIMSYYEKNIAKMEKDINKIIELFAGME